MLASISLISCSFCHGPPLKPSIRTQALKIPLSLVIQSRPSSQFLKRTSKFSAFLKPSTFKPHNWRSPLYKPKSLLHVCRSSLNSPDSEEKKISDGERDWTSSILLLVLWGALLYYVFNLAPNQTPTQDSYFLKKLLNLKGDDGFRMNQILVSLWYIMGLWPLVYSMLLLPTGRSSKKNIPVWPFVVLSFFGGAYALLPFFVIWSPPSPPVMEEELRNWPLNFLESKITAGITLVAGLGIIFYAFVMNGGDWKEFYRYFQGSRFIHITSLDFCLLSAFAPFWVYNDMTARKWYHKGWWLLLVSFVPFLGPSLYLVLRPPLTGSMNPKTSESEQ